MRLRNICNNHTRIPRRALRIALAVALATGGCSALYGDNPLAGSPRPLPSVGAAEAELLPYPFAEMASPQSASPQALAEHRVGVSRQLVKLLGLDRPTQLAEANTTPRSKGPMTLPQALPTMTLPTMGVALKPVQGEVVTASATEEQHPAVQAAPMPALPVAAAAAEVSLSESLLDIEIPTGLAMSSAAAKSCPQSEHCGTTGLPSLDPMSGVVQACEPPALHHSPTLASQAAAEVDVAKTKGTSPASRQPDIVRSPQAMSLTVNPQAAVKAAGSVSLNLNDSPSEGQASETKKGTGGSDNSRGAVLHLSSASDEVTLSTQVATSKTSALPVAPRLPMSVARLAEPVLSKLSDAPSSPERPADRSPMLEATPAASPQTRLAAAEKTLSPVKAVLASRTSPVVSYGSNSDMTPRSSGPAIATARASSNALAVGLQESHTLSTDYSISELSVEHPNICQLLKTSDRSVSVIGMRPGATRIALVSYDSQGERTVDVREIAVGDSAVTSVNLPELAKEISRTVAHMYPKSDVQIVAYQDHVVVRGYTNYESDAKKILALVRKTSLAPVVDQLTTSGN